MRVHRSHDIKTRVGWASSGEECRRCGAKSAIKLKEPCPKASARDAPQVPVTK